MIAGFGQTSQEPFAQLDRAKCCWKTFLPLFQAADCPSYSQIWPNSGSLLSGQCFPASNLGPRTTDVDSSCWPTPVARDSTPRGRQGSRNSLSLRDAIDVWPTPTTQNNGRDRARIKSRSLSELCQDFGPQDHTNALPPPQLVQPNPEFLEWLMGFPLQWSDPTTDPECERWETQFRLLWPLWLTLY